MRGVQCENIRLLSFDFVRTVLNRIYEKWASRTLLSPSRDELGATWIKEHKLRPVTCPDLSFS